MNALRFYSACVITAILLMFCVILFEPTRQMLLSYHDTGLGPGAMPAVSLVGIFIFSLYIFSLELRRFRSSRGIAEDPQEAVDNLGMPVRAFVTRSVIAMALLWLYIVLWRLTSFVPATVVFTISLGLSALPRSDWTKKHITRMILVLGGFSFVVWLIFAYLLEVNLR